MDTNTERAAPDENDLKAAERIGCIVMASGLSRRYGKNKLLEKVGDREVILHTTGRLHQAGLDPLTVTRSGEVKALLEREGFRCLLHDGPLKSDTMHAGLKSMDACLAGCMFMPADQPLVMPATYRKLVRRFLECPDQVIRLGYGGSEGSPVIFPGSFRAELLSYGGDRGGMEVLRRQKISCRVMQASHPWELWDVDTPESMERVREAYRWSLGSTRL